MSHPLEKLNLKFQKRQKELAKKKQTEEKRQRKLDKNAAVKPAKNQVGPAENGEVKWQTVLWEQTARQKGRKRLPDRFVDGTRKKALNNQGLNFLKV